jgi:hypothetical protein
MDIAGGTPFSWQNARNSFVKMTDAQRGSFGRALRIVRLSRRKSLIDFGFRQRRRPAHWLGTALALTSICRFLKRNLNTSIPDQRGESEHAFVTLCSAS